MGGFKINKNFSHKNSALIFKLIQEARINILIELDILIKIPIIIRKGLMAKALAESDGNPDYRIFSEGGAYTIQNLLSGTYTTVFKNVFI